MNFVEKAALLFATDRPVHFTDYLHCEECREHDETLRAATPDTIGIEELGNPGWDPLCFCSDHGIKYYFPALIRLCMDTVEEEFYFEQLLFHLQYAGEQNRILLSCSDEQREFVASFIEFMIDSWPDKLDDFYASESALSAYELWSLR